VGETFPVHISDNSNELPRAIVGPREFGRRPIYRYRLAVTIAEKKRSHMLYLSFECCACAIRQMLASP
jgi:hypothetical protein